MKRFTFLTLLILMEVFENSSGEATLRRRQQVATLQCHVCENCALDEDLSQEMQMCGDSGDFGQMMTQTPSSKTTTAATTTTTSHFSTKISESDEYEEYSYEEVEGEHHKVEQETEKEADEKRDGNRTTTITTPPTSAPSNVNASSPRATLTSTLAQTLPETTTETKPDKDEYEDDAPNEYAESRRMSVNASQYVCYVIHLNVNNTVITNRGCATLRGNKYLTCQTLSKGLSIENCQVCSSDGCNANSYEAWFSAATAATRFSHMLRSVSVLLLSYMAMLLR